jgi:hypothetical protein
MRRFAIVIVMVGVLFSPPALAQTLEVEVQGGAGYVHDSGEGPSVPTVAAGAVLWLTPHVGISGRYARGIGDDHFDPPVSGGDRTFFGPGGLRMWAATIEWRGFQNGFEFNAGLGWGGHSYEYQEILTGIRRAGGSIDPITPKLLRQRYGIGMIASEVLVGHRIVGPFHLKAGFTYGLAGDVHPFQPVVVLSFKAR